MKCNGLQTHHFHVLQWIPFVIEMLEPINVLLNLCMKTKGKYEEPNFMCCVQVDRNTNLLSDKKQKNMKMSWTLNAQCTKITKM